MWANIHSQFVAAQALARAKLVANGYIEEELPPDIYCTAAAVQRWQKPLWDLSEDYRKQQLAAVGKTRIMHDGSFVCPRSRFGHHTPMVVETAYSEARSDLDKAAINWMHIKNIP